MLYLLIFILSCYGLTAILTWGKIFNKIRPKNIGFFHCAQCVGTWVGFGVFSVFWFSGVRLFPNFYAGIFLFGCISGGMSYILNQLFGDCGLRIENKVIKQNKTTN